MFATVWGALAFTLVLRAAHATPALAEIASADDVPPAHLPNVIRIHGLRFDISKLISATPLSVWKSESTPPTRTTLEYRLNLQGPLKHNATVAEGRQVSRRGRRHGEPLNPNAVPRGDVDVLQE